VGKLIDIRPVAVRLTVRIASAGHRWTNRQMSGRNPYRRAFEG
jgi:hypothetical protein